MYRSFRRDDGVHNRGRLFTFQYFFEKYIDMTTIMNNNT